MSPRRPGGLTRRGEFAVGLAITIVLLAYCAAAQALIG